MLIHESANQLIQFRGGPQVMIPNIKPMTPHYKLGLIDILGQHYELWGDSVLASPKEPQPAEFGGEEPQLRC